MPGKDSFPWLSKNITALKNMIFKRIYVSPKQEKNVVNQFHKLYYDSQVFGKTWADTFWLGLRTAKCPFDLWIYQEIIWELRPDVIIETGTLFGGSAFFLASICDLVNHGKILSIDVEDKPDKPQHKRIEYFLSSSTSQAAVEKVKSLEPLT